MKWRSKSKWKFVELYWKIERFFRSFFHQLEFELGLGFSYCLLPSSRRSGPAALKTARNRAADMG